MRERDGARERVRESVSEREYGGVTTDVGVTDGEKERI